MSLGTKPLIFLEPLSQTLQKLKEVVEENSEAEGIEVFEIDSLEEAVQLLPTIGQCLVLTSSPKKCAMMLQQNKRTIKKLQSKTILLSPKSIPRKTLDKFMKVGLTECVVEPVNPKTLLYKVRLQLRSISTQKEEDQEMSTKFGQGESEAPVDTQQKLRAEKGVILDDETGEAPAKKEKKETQENVLDDYSKPKKKTYQEEALSSYYKNTTKKREEEEELDEEGNPRKGYKEEAIEGHYKGNLEKQAPIEEEEEEQKKRAGLQLEEDLEEVKRKINEETISDVARLDRKKQLEFEEEVAAKKKSNAPIVENEKDSSAKSKSEVEDLGGHYKGKMKKGLEVEDEAEYRERTEKEEGDLTEKERQKKLAIEDDEEDKDFIDEQEEFDEGPSKEKKKKLQIVDDESPDYLDEKEEELIDMDEGKDKIKLDVEVDYDEDDKEGLLPEETAEKERKKRDAKADQIDGYLRGGAAKKNLSLEDDEDLYKDEAQELLNEEKRRKKAALNIEEDTEKDPLLDEHEYDEDFGGKKKKASLSVVDEDFDRQREKGVQEDERDFGSRQAGLKVEDDEFGRKKLAPKEEEKKKGHNRSNARADHIKTHYSSLESLRHNDDDWGDGWEKPEKAQDDFPHGSQEEKELIIESEDLGEQTIDYAQLKKEFEGITIDGIPNKKKEYGVFDNVAQIKTYTKKVLTPEGELEDMEFEEVQAKEEEQETEKVFEPQSLGMEYAIEVLDFYFAKESEPLSLCEYIHEKVSKQFDGSTVFYTSKRGEKLDILFNGFVFQGVGKPPEKPSQEELDSLTRSERKEFEDDYRKDLSEYEREIESRQKAWDMGPARRFSQWVETSTPSWLDHTFQQKENEFVFPFYEGLTLLGLAVFIPGSTFNPEKADSLEALFEVSRGIFLSEFHQTVGSTKQREALSSKKPKEEKEEKKGGFFSKIFKRGA